MQQTNRSLRAHVCDATSQALGIVSQQEIKAARRARKAQRCVAQQANIVTGMPVDRQHVQVFHGNQAQLPCLPPPPMTMQVSLHPVYAQFYTAYDGTMPYVSLPAMPMSVQMATTATGLQASSSLMPPPPPPPQQQQQQQHQEQEQQQQQHDVIMQQQKEQPQLLLESSSISSSSRCSSSSDVSSALTGARTLLEIGMTQNTATQQQVENMQNVVHETFERNVLVSHGMSAPSTDRMPTENAKDDGGLPDGGLPEHEATECTSTGRMQSVSTRASRLRETTMDAFNRRVESMFGHVLSTPSLKKIPWRPPCVPVLGAFTMSQEETEAAKKYFNDANHRMYLANDISDSTGGFTETTRFVSTSEAFEVSILRAKTMHFVERVVDYVGGELLHGAALWSLGNEESLWETGGDTCRGKRQFYHFDWNVHALEEAKLSAWTLVFTMDEDAVLGFARFTHTKDGSGIPNQSSRFVLKFKQFSAVLFRHDLWHCGEIYKKFHMRIHYYIGPKGKHPMMFRSSKKEKAKPEDLELFSKEDPEHYSNTAIAGLSGLIDTRVIDVSSHPSLTPASLADEATLKKRVTDLTNRAKYPVCKGGMPAQDKKPKRKG